MFLKSVEKASRKFVQLRQNKIFLNPVIKAYEEPKMIESFNSVV